MSVEAIKQLMVKIKKKMLQFVRHSKMVRSCNISPEVLFRGCVVNDHGDRNRIIIETGAKVCHCTFTFDGSNNTVHIGKNVTLNSCAFYTAGAGNEICIGEGTTVTGKTEFIVTEGTKILVGEDCMFAYGIVLRTGDFHPIFNKDAQRINEAQSIKLGNHVWLGQNVCVLKGVSIASGCVVGACSVVTKMFDTENAVLAGNPARVIKTDMYWERELR